MIQCNLPMKQFYKTKKSINQGLCQVNCSNSCFYCQRLKSNTCLKYKCWNDVNRVFKSLALESSIVYVCLRWNRGLEREMVLPCLNKRTFSPLATGNLNSNYQQKGQFIPIMCRNSTGFQTLIRIFFFFLNLWFATLRRRWGVGWRAFLIASFAPERTEKQPVQPTRSLSLFSG